MSANPVAAAGLVWCVCGTAEESSFVGFAVGHPTFVGRLGGILETVSSGAAVPVLANLGVIMASRDIVLANDSTSVAVRSALSTDSDDCNLSVRRPKSVILPTHFFGRIVGGLPSGRTAVRIFGNLRIQVASKATRFAVGNRSTGGCPRLPRIRDRGAIRLTSSVLHRIVSRAQVTISGRRDQPVLAKVRMALGGKVLATMTASDRHLTRHGIRLPRATSHSFSVILPKTSVARLTGVVTSRGSNIGVRVARGRTLFVFNGARFCSHLLRNGCPRADHLVPRSSSAHLRVATDSLLTSVRQTSLLSRRDHGGIIGLDIGPRGGVTAISNASTSINGIRRRVGTSRVMNGPLRVSFGPSCVHSTLGSFNRAGVLVSFAATLQPFALMPARRGTGFIRLVAPIQAC